MNSTFSAFTLLAQYDRWRRLGDGLRGSGSRSDLSDLLPFFIVLGLVCAGIAVAVQIYKRRDFSKPCDDPQKLLRQLCAVHHLNYSSQRLLVRMATALELPHPAVLFVTPSAFSASELPAQLSKEAEQIRQLGKQLF